MKIEKLQYQLSNGDWADCDDRTDDFLARCIKYGNVENEVEAIRKLVAGESLRNWFEGWDANCRIKPKSKNIKIELIKCDCGHSIAKQSVMHASTGSSCPNCYDRMSM